MRYSPRLNTTSKPPSMLRRGLISISTTSGASGVVQKKKVQAPFGRDQFEHILGSLDSIYLHTSDLPRDLWQTCETPSERMKTVNTYSSS